MAAKSISGTKVLPSVAAWREDLGKAFTFKTDSSGKLAPGALTWIGGTAPVFKATSASGKPIEVLFDLTLEAWEKEPRPGLNSRSTYGRLAVLEGTKKRLATPDEAAAFLAEVEEKVPPADRRHSFIERAISSAQTTVKAGVLSRAQSKLKRFPEVLSFSVTDKEIFLGLSPDDFKDRAFKQQIKSALEGLPVRFQCQIKVTGRGAAGQQMMATANWNNLTADQQERYWQGKLHPIEFFGGRADSFGPARAG